MGSVETILKDELARADRALGGIAPVLSHMLASSGHALVSDAIVARVRGMLNDMARQMLEAIGRVQPATEENPLSIEALSDALGSDPAILNHCHAAAMEGHLAERLDQRSSVDPVLSPLWQELIASDDPVTGELAMSAMAAQSRFIQSQRRMQQPLSELPADILERSIRIWQRSNPAELGAAIGMAVQSIKQDYDEAESRIGQLARLVLSMRGGAIAALELDHAGLALFTSALAALTDQDRGRAVMACHEGQAARLAVALRAAGLNPQAIERQFLLLEPAQMLPLGLDAMSTETAAAILRQSRFENGR
ncbi:MAG: hypothetical protein AAFR88_04020 [Pseudomonadota bacterium]